MNLFTKRFGLVLTSVIGVGAIATLATGASFALFSATGPTQNNTFAAGTVTLPSSLSTGSVTLNLTNMAPGDTGSGSYVLDYTGSIPAFLGLKVTTSGDTGLGITLAVTDVNNDSGYCIIGTNTGAPFWCTTSTVNPTVIGGSPYVVPVDHNVGTQQDIYMLPGLNTVCETDSGLANNYTACPTSLPSNAVQTWGDIAAPNQAVNLQLDVSLPLSAGNQYQGEAVTVTLQLIAVQAPNNINSTGCPSTSLCPTAWS
jgi:hypothetical protein